MRATGAPPWPARQPRGTGPGDPPTSGGSSWGRLDAFDAKVDAVLGHLRGHRRVDAAASVLSNLADYGLVWVLVAAVKGRRPGSGRRDALRALAVAGSSSVTVNALVKGMVRRGRPVADGSPATLGARLVRRPRSTSFPSGHTLAAFCTAVVLADGPAEGAAFLTFAAAVAVSRVHLRAHHASDVIAGALIGTAVGTAGRRLARSARGPSVVRASPLTGPGQGPVVGRGRHPLACRRA